MNVNYLLFIYLELKYLKTSNDTRKSPNSSSDVQVLSIIKVQIDNNKKPNLECPIERLALIRQRNSFLFECKCYHCAYWY